MTAIGRGACVEPGKITDHPTSVLERTRRSRAPTTDIRPPTDAMSSHPYHNARLTGSFGPTTDATQSRPASGDPAPEHLEVASLGVVGGVGVVAAGTGAIEDLQALLVAVRGLADKVLEGLG